MSFRLKNLNRKSMFQILERISLHFMEEGKGKKGRKGRIDN